MVFSGMLVVALAFGLVAGACPITIAIGHDGAVFSNRMQGWYRTSPKTLTGVLRGGCYNDANASPVTSVNVEVAPNAPRERIDQVFSILEKGAGRNRESECKCGWMHLTRLIDSDCIR